jgi:multidrug efflux pump subunit AcrA (membrane-fusion protein)
VRAELAGQVKQTLVDEGQRVRVGTLLARLDDTAVRDA